MEKTIQVKLKAPRLLRFVAEGRHRRPVRPYTNPLLEFDTQDEKRKHVVGMFSYSYTVSYSWLTPSSQVELKPSPVALTCPCGVGI
jgi:hypothetical protein